MQLCSSSLIPAIFVTSDFREVKVYPPCQPVLFLSNTITDQLSKCKSRSRQALQPLSSKTMSKRRAPLLPTVLSLLSEDRPPTFRGFVPVRVRRTDIPGRTERRTHGRPGTSGGGNRIVRFAADHKRVPAVAAFFLFRFAAECLVAVVFTTYLFLSCGCSLLIHTTSKSAATSFISI